MIFTDSGIVLLRQDFREADRIIALYTQAHGRIHVRLPGVNRSKGKLKALSEPCVCADYRVYQRSHNTLGTITGGKIQHIFPHIRQSLNRQLMALHCCELMIRFTPVHQPNQNKYQLLLQALSELNEQDPLPAFAPAFTLRLMMAAGFGLDHPVLHIPDALWPRMHEDTYTNLPFSDTEDLLCLSKCNEVCRRFLNQYLTYPLQTVKPIGLTEDTFSSETEAPLTDDVRVVHSLKPVTAH